MLIAMSTKLSDPREDYVTPRVWYDQSVHIKVM